MLLIGQGRVAVRSESVVGQPKSGRSRRDLPMPADLVTTLRALKATQQREAMALGIGWSDERLIAVREDGEPVRHE
ncbi:MAG: hypothetical protein WBH51_17000 [Mycolicibacter algericus]|uniref:Uncharacterized protein n=2 Tax=Mycolicibacter algericus TaxID=1288388 RepID=A0A7I9Y8C3_MYCAL|nr:hypothetical protein [Mycolicibacter algericus]OQZ94796.1 hypothetical protein BST10_17545 [Mycolicibacter algericus DSM 45454]GFG84847.1 hypothetical protein MALGJ_15230 [Mycolicibacter algericus]